MPDPLIQAPASTQNFNRYSYCLNNPLKYTDENGEIIEWLIPVIYGLVEGTINIIGDWQSIDNFWEGLASFSAGAITGVLSFYDPIVGGTVGGFTEGLVSGIIEQTGNGNSLNDITIDEALIKATIGGVTGMMSASTANALKQWNPIGKALGKIGNNSVTRKIAAVTTATINNSISGGIYGLFDDIGTSILSGDWSHFGERTISGLQFGAISGLTMSSCYLGLSSLLSDPRNIPSLNAYTTEVATALGEFGYDQDVSSNSLNATIVVCDTASKRTYVFTYVPQPKNGAVPLQNMYIYDNFERLFSILSRLHL